jgi:hypothetical protein
MGQIWTQKPPLGSQIDWSNPLSKGLVGCWLMNEGGGNVAKDLYSNNNGKAYSGSLQYGKNGILVNSFNSQILLGNSYTASCSFSVVVQFMPIGNPIVVNHSIYQSYNGVGGLYLRLLTDGHFDFLQSQITDISQVAVPYALNKKYTLGFSIDATGNYKLYEGGIERSRTLGTGVTAQTFALGVPRLGTESNSFGGYEISNGYFYFCYIFNRALSPQEIQQLYIDPYGMILHPSNRFIIPATSSVVNASVTQTQAWLNLSSGTQVISTPAVPVSASVTQFVTSLAIAGGTQAISTVQFSSVTQIAASLSISAGTQVASTAPIASITQSAKALTFTPGTQTIASISTVFISQNAANLALSTGTQTISTGAIVLAAITQSAASATIAKGTQAVASVQNITITQTATSLTVTVGTQTVLALRTASISQITTGISLAPGSQSINIFFTVTSAVIQAYTPLTLGSGIQLITSVLGGNTFIAALIVQDRDTFIWTTYGTSRVKLLLQEHRVKLNRNRVTQTGWDIEVYDYQTQ